jgi:hypothetical protein
MSKRTHPVDLSGMDTAGAGAGGRRWTGIYLGGSVLLCIAIHLLVVFLVTVFSRADDYLADLDVAAGPWIGIVFLPEIVLAAGAALAVASPLCAPRLMRLAIRVAYLSIVLVVAWALSSQDQSQQLIWLFEGLFGGS